MSRHSLACPDGEDIHSSQWIKTKNNSITIKGNQKAAYWSYSKLKKHWKYNQSGQIRYAVKYKVGKWLRSVKTSLVLSNVIDADHQKGCLLTNKGHFSSPS